MKRTLLPLIITALLLTGCAGVAADPWPEGVDPISSRLGATAVAGFTLNESNDILSFSGLYYATWTLGEGKTISNADGDEAQIFDAQIYVVVKECANAEKAEQNVQSWMAREQEVYTATAPEENTFSGQSFRTLTLLSGSKTNPYAFGAAGFAVCGSDAISVELLCAQDFTGDADAILAAFLNGLKYRP